jgi:hypothetical protein
MPALGALAAVTASSIVLETEINKAVNTMETAQFSQNKNKYLPGIYIYVHLVHV